MIKRFAVVVALLTILTACQTGKKQSTQKTLFVSLLPMKYFADQLTGGLYRVEVMVPPGVGPETYSPTPRQMSAMADASLYFSTGHLGFEEAWSGNFKSVNPRLTVVDCSEGVELIAGMEEQHGDHTHAHGVDPHIWSSPKTVKTMVKNMHAALVATDPANKELFDENFEKFNAAIDSVDREVNALLEPLTNRQFLIFHPALGYFARDYGLSQLSIEFEGKAPTPGHMQEVISHAKSQNFKVILIQKEFDRENAEIVARETGCRIVQIDPLSYEWSAEMIAIAGKLADNLK